MTGTADLTSRTAVHSLHGHMNRCLIFAVWIFSAAFAVTHAITCIEPIDRTLPATLHVYGAIRSVSAVDLTNKSRETYSRRTDRLYCCICKYCHRHTCLHRTSDNQRVVRHRKSCTNHPCSHIQVLRRMTCNIPRDKLTMK